MSIDIVRGELERLFSLDELMALSSDLLGLPAAEVGGGASKASFARALTDKAVEVSAVEALVDAVLASRAEVDPRFRELGQKGLVLPEELKAGDTFGPFTIVKKIGEGPRAFVYAAQQAGKDRTLKVFRREATRDARALRRYLVKVRLAARVRHENLPAELTAGIEDGRAWTAYAPIDGQPLASRIARTGPLHVNEARNVLRGVLGALGALHEQRLSHGALKLENVVVARGEGGAMRPFLVDVGGDRLLGATPWSSPASVKAASPEQLRGGASDAASDLYAFGAMLFEVLSGKPAFTAESGVDLAVAHLTATAPAPSVAAPRGWVSKELDELTARLLGKAPGDRPKGVAGVLDILDPKAAAAPKDGKKAISDEELNDKVDALLADPSDGAAALALESSIELGADAAKVAEAFQIAADQVEEGEDEAVQAQGPRVQEGAPLPRRAHLRVDPQGPRQGRGRVRRAAGGSTPRTTSPSPPWRSCARPPASTRSSSRCSSRRARRARAAASAPAPSTRLATSTWGRWTTASRPPSPSRKRPRAGDDQRRVRRRPGARRRHRHEALDRGARRAEPGEPRRRACRPRPRSRSSRASATGTRRRSRAPTSGVPCFQAVLSVDPAHPGALEGLANVYRRAQQWQELGQVLVTRADRAPTPAAARDLRAEAADLLETRLNESAHARDLYETIFAEDPGHQKATDALARIYARLDDWAGLAKILERRAEALRGEAKVEAMCKLAELYEDQLNNLPEATRRYEAALAEDPRSLTALKGLDRIYNRTGNYKELLQNLEKQLELSATPRQKIKLYERIAGIQDEEFLNHEKAAEALEQILAIDGAHEGALSALVRHYRALDRWEDAVQLYEKNLRIVADDKRKVDLYLAMGRVLVDQVGSPERARKAYEKVLEIDPNHAGALESLAHVRAATGDAMAALSAIESLAEKSPTPEGKADLVDPRRPDARREGRPRRRHRALQEGPRRPARQPLGLGRAARRLPGPRRRHQRRRAHHPRAGDRRRQPRQGAPLRRDGAAPPREAQGQRARPRRGEEGGRPRSRPACSASSSRATSPSTRGTSWRRPRASSRSPTASTRSPRSRA